MKKKLIFSILSAVVALAAFISVSPCAFAAEVTEETEIAEEATTGFAIKDIKKIYTPKSIDATRLVSQMNSFICTKDGEVYKDFKGFGIGMPDTDNTSNYSFDIFWSSGSFVYQKNVPVEITPYDYKMGYVEFTDGDIAVLYNTQEKYTYEEIIEGIGLFLNAKGLSILDLNIPEKTSYITKLYEGSYSGGKVYLEPTGVNIYYTTKDNPTDETKEKEGYVCLYTIKYTKDFTRAEALSIVKDQLLLLDGKLVTDYDVEFVEREGSNYVTAIFTQNGEQIYEYSINTKQIESNYSYVLALAFDFDYGYIAIPKQDSNSYSLNKFMSDIIKTFRSILGTFDNNTTIDFTKPSKADVDGVYRVGNGAYYSYEYNVEIIDRNPTQDTNPDASTDSSVSTDELDEGKTNIITDTFNKIKENDAAKITTGIISCILGVGIIYVLFIIFRKLFRCLRK